MESGKTVIVLTFAIVVSLAICNVAGQANRCDGLPPNQIFLLPHEYNCSLYYECRNGISRLLACQNGLWYNHRTQSCDFPEVSDCRTAAVQCTNILLDYFPNVYDCTKYIECYLGDAYEMNCPNGYWFSSNSKSCVPPTQSDCYVAPPYTTPEPQCYGVRPNEIVLSRYQGDCSKYWKCDGATLTLESCPYGLFFDERRQLCDFPITTDCDASTGTPPGPDVTTRPPLVPEPIEDPRCIGNDLSYWPHPVDCHRYIQCYGGASYDVECPPGLYFSDIRKQCVYPTLSECGQPVTTERTTTEHDSNWTPDPDCNWPEGEGSLIPFPGDCTRFFECADGRKVPMDCPDGLWFNWRFQICDYPYEADCRWGLPEF